MPSWTTRGEGGCASVYSQGGEGDREPARAVVVQQAVANTRDGLAIGGPDRQVDRCIRRKPAVVVVFAAQRGLRRGSDLGREMDARLDGVEGRPQERGDEVQGPEAAQIGRREA